MLNCGLIAKRLRGGITFVGSNTVRTQSTSQLNCQVPAGTVSGDLIVAVVTCAHPTNVTFSLLTSGFTKRGDYFQASSDAFLGAQLAVFTKPVSGTPDTQVSINGVTADADTFLCVMVFRGVNQTTPLDTAIEAGGATGSSAELRVQGANPVTKGAMIVGGGIMASFFSVGGVSTSLTAPAGWTLAAGQQRQSSNTRVGNIGLAFKKWNGSGAENRSDPFGGAYYLGTSQCSYNFSIVLRPAT